MQSLPLEIFKHDFEEDKLGRIKRSLISNTVTLLRCLKFFDWQFLNPF